MSTLLTVEAAGDPAKAKAPPYDEHVVKRGETLWSIAQKYNTSVGEVMDYNQLGNHDLRENMKLRIPRRGSETQQGARPQFHRVKEGDTFWNIASAHNITTDALADANPHVQPNRLKLGAELIIPAADATLPRASATATPKQEQKGTSHTVATGETFYSISKLHGVPVAALTAANPNVQPERMKTGMQVIIPGKTAPASKPALPPESKPALAARLHTVKDGESFTTIAKNYGVTTEALLRHNRMSNKDDLYIGDVLAIPHSRSAPPTSGTRAGGVDPVTPTLSQPAAPTPPSPPAPVAPKSPPAGEAPAVRTYTVNDGETATAISEEFGISKQRLLQYNGLPANAKLREGQELQIPPR